MRPAIVKTAMVGKDGMAASSSVGPRLTLPRVPGRNEQPVLASEAEFRRAIRREKGRTERSHSPFILMLVDAGSVLLGSPKLLPGILGAIARSTRDTDFVGWYLTGSVLGVIFTEVRPTGVTQQAETLLERTRRALAGTVSVHQADQMGLSIHICPEDDADNKIGAVRLHSPIDDEFEESGKAVALAIKRGMDIIGSVVALLLFAPVLLAVAIAVKVSSKGPVLFMQQRVGQGGRMFSFIKFRSMKTDNDPSIHRAYVEQFIQKKSADAVAEEQGNKPLYKIPNDPRVTKVGAFLRRTSLDEFPQFYNVLKGEMSLVGPRPPIPYEVNRYDAWHKRRYLSVKPGLTGLWQVHGRSRTTFDEMVRLDLLYARTWTVWGDIKILLQTPFAVLNGDGAI